MLHEKRNNSDRWTNSLDQLNEHPEGFDRNASWEQLHKRLQVKPRKESSAAWFWAAASVVLVAALIWVIGVKDEQEIVQATTATRNTRIVASDTARSAPDVKKQFIEEKKKVASENAAPKAIDLKEGEMKILNIDQTLVSDISAIQDSVRIGNNAIAVLQRKSIDPDTTIALISNAKTQKRKLKVVHINQLDKRIEDNRRLVHVQRSFSGSTPMGTDTYMHSYTPGDNIIKIKLSPNN